jgi:5-methylcytosine-specific restriction protein A
VREPLLFYSVITAFVRSTEAPFKRYQTHCGVILAPSEKNLRMSSRATFLFAWNPVKWPWPEIAETAAAVSRGEKFVESWHCVSHKKVKPGDRAFFTHVGATPRGLFASGHVISEPVVCTGRKGSSIYCVKVEFDVLLDPATMPILTLDILRIGRLEKQLWTPQTSGISIQPQLTGELEALWADFLANGSAFQE